MPELRRRGLFWDDYAVTGGTVRENYFEKPGEKRLPQGHPGSKYKWRAGEKVPSYAKEDVSVSISDEKATNAKANGLKRKIETDDNVVNVVSVKRKVV